MREKVEYMGMRIRNRRVALGMTLTDVAARIGTTHSVISKWERGDIVNIGAKNLEKLAYVLDVPSGWLMFGTKTPTNHRTSAKRHSQEAKSKIVNDSESSILTTGTCCVYKHTSPDGKVYIGITSNTAEQRWNDGAGYCENTRFTKDILKFGWSNFRHEILFSDKSRDDALGIESVLITLYQSTNPLYGYNQTNDVTEWRKALEYIVSITPMK